MKSESWWGKSGNQLRCPVPECDHIGTMITNAHCRVAHEMEREQVGELHGMPTIVPNKNIDWSVERGEKN